MTCVVGIAAEGYVWIGADSASVDNWTVRQCLTPKVFSVGEVLIGYTSSFRMGQILRWQLELPEPPERHPERLESAAPYIEQKVIEAVRTVLHRQHWATETQNKQEGCGLLLGYRGHLFEVGDEYAVVEMAEGYDAIGAGCDFALGALHAIDDMRWQPESRIKAALKAAADMSGAVIGPFYIMCLWPDGTVGLLP